MNKTAIVTGVTGQDGSYLSDLLLEKGYKVYGFKRRSANHSLGCSAHLENDIEVVEGDLLDLPSLSNLCRLVRPHMFFNLAAQSHVRTSFDQPANTLQINGLGVLHCLEAIKQSGIYTRFYQASTSEMFGGVMHSGENILSEKSIFHPRSPYGCAKLYGHWIAVNYRESYNMFNCCGVLFNHECVSSYVPIIYRENNIVDIAPISEIVDSFLPSNKKRNGLKESYDVSGSEIEVWDKDGWTKVKTVSRFEGRDQGRRGSRIINARNSVCHTTNDHVWILEDQEKTAYSVEIGDGLKNIKLEDIKPNNTEIMSYEECVLLGLLVGDGYISQKNKCQFTNKNKLVRDKFSSLWNEVTSGYCRDFNSTSGFTGKVVNRLDCFGGADWLDKYDLYIDEIIEGKHRSKRIPWQILNTTVENQKAFLDGYNMADGLKSNPCIYEYKNFKTNSATLAQGLIYLIQRVTGQVFNITIEESDKWGYKTFYYSINLLSNSDSGQNQRNSQEKAKIVNNMIQEGLSQREIFRKTGISRGFIRKVQNGYVPTGIHHFSKGSNEVKKIIDYSDYDGWFYDLETDSGTFHAGVGCGLIHNSPRRGPNFVTRKISIAVAKIKNGLQEKLYLGNLDAKRDWGHARDYVKGMFAMLNHNEPDDYVLSTGKAYSVREFCKHAFEHAGLGDYQNYVEIDPKFYRPAEVHVLLGDSTKARKVLGWEHSTTFEELVKDMVDADMKKVEANL